MSIKNENGIILNPSLNGKECRHDGEHIDENGNRVDCHCGECSYYLNCFGHEVEGYFKNEINKRKA